MGVPPEEEGTMKPPLIDVAGPLDPKAGKTVDTMLLLPHQRHVLDRIERAQCPPIPSGGAALRQDWRDRLQAVGLISTVHDSVLLEADLARDIALDPLPAPPMSPRAAETYASIRDLLAGAQKLRKPMGAALDELVSEGTVQGLDVAPTPAGVTLYSGLMTRKAVTMVALSLTSEKPWVPKGEALVLWDAIHELPGFKPPEPQHALLTSRPGQSSWQGIYPTGSSQKPNVARWLTLECLYLYSGLLPASCPYDLWSKDLHLTGIEAAMRGGRPTRIPDTWYRCKHGIEVQRTKLDLRDGQAGTRQSPSAPRGTSGFSGDLARSLAARGVWEAPQSLLNVVFSFGAGDAGRDIWATPPKVRTATRKDRKILEQIKRETWARVWLYHALADYLPSPVEPVFPSEVGDIAHYGRTNTGRMSAHAATDPYPWPSPPRSPRPQDSWHWNSMADIENDILHNPPSSDFIRNTVDFEQLELRLAAAIPGVTVLSTLRDLRRLSGFEALYGTRDLHRSRTPLQNAPIIMDDYSLVEPSRVSEADVQANLAAIREIRALAKTAPWHHIFIPGLAPFPPVEAPTADPPIDGSDDPPSGGSS